MKEFIIPILMVMLLFLSFVAEAKVVKFSDNLKTVKLKNPVDKTVSFASRIGDFGKVSSLCKELQAKKVARNKRMQEWRIKVKYIPDDCDRSYWNRHHVAHYCNNSNAMK